MIQRSFSEIESLLNNIKSEFPDVVDEIDFILDQQGFKFEDKAFSIEMEAFSQITTNAIKHGKLESAKKYLSFVSNKLESATKKELEYIDVYYVESLMWDIEDKEIIRIGWSIIPSNLKELYIEMWGEPDL